MNVKDNDLNNLQKDNKEVNQENKLFKNECDEDEKIKEYKIIKRKVKVNGCSTPFTLYQITSWIIFTAQAIWVFYIFREFLKDQSTLNFIYLTLNGAFYILILIFGTIASYCNPIDDMITQQMNGIQIDENKKTHQCKICNLFVSEKTKHCGVCNKCVFEFDHHCEWLNNCIGSKNYKYFILLVCSLIGELLTSISYTAYSLALYSNDYESYVQRSEFSLSCKTFLGLSIAVIIINIVSFLFCLQLVLYHAWLKIKGITTYEHIVKNRKKQQEKAKHKIDYKKSNKEQVRNQTILDQTHGVINSKNQQNNSQQNKLSQNLEMTNQIQKVDQQEQQLQHIFGTNPLNQTNDILLDKKQNNLQTGSQFCNNNLEISVIVERIQGQDMKINFLQFSNPDEVLSNQNSQINEYTPNCIQNKDKKDNLSIQNDTQNEIDRQNEDAQTQQTHQEIIDQVAIFHGRKIIQKPETNNKSLRKSCSESQYKNDLENQIKNKFYPAQQKSQQNLSRIQSANSRKNSQNKILQNNSDQFKSKSIKVQPLKPHQPQQQQSKQQKSQCNNELQIIDSTSNKKDSDETIVIKQQNFF
ncbi:DHHC zinc finger protein (macronuclear) [Tetrahymena thermophila SB210]|uniref:Palmitoyltransferase n=1 Tax=Tetrahymena thermophila (strain SB210) TaxID=312017 RepID=Q22Z76_TETTS|nr:DHHC zinc finger protein [Tetrahymena thermophila SB210]EAR90445.2 DHHC zinc finger protein [Tetrahymena thermophila SB210]|eukprot:XP_001010690.2 DHHC zinc finger protein [Tetrahymena thermophila SB210]